MYLNLKEGAIFIADAHYPHFGSRLLEVLEAIESGEIDTPQLILMGDIFDLLFGCGNYIQSFSKDAIEALNRVSNKKEVIYLEGNHDFYLKRVFRNIKIYSIAKQPLKMRLGSKLVMLSHGDKFEVGIGYKIYSSLIRSGVVLNLLRVAERFIINRNIQRLKQKSICRGEFVGFEKKVKKILTHYPKDVDLVVEGHFHQGVKIQNYISLPSLVCQEAIGVVENREIVFKKIDNLLKAKS
jgi:UDP-2,3-diacylglucosamine hydrolase